MKRSIPKLHRDARRTLLLTAPLALAACVTYVTPGGAAPLETLDRAGVVQGSSRQPSPQFPAELAVVRVQMSAYRSYSEEGIGRGRFSVIAAPDAATLAQPLARWPSVESAAALDPAFLPEVLDSLDDLRSAAAKMQADVLLVYTLDTRFGVQGGRSLAPDSAVPSDSAGSATIACEASAVFVDVRTGFRYGTAKATANAEAGPVAAARSPAKLDRARLEVERKAQAQLFADAARAWSGIVEQYQ